MPADFEDILKNVKERDYIDSHRETSPLRKADDALELDNSHMTIDEQKAWLMARYMEKRQTDTLLPCDVVYIDITLTRHKSSKAALLSD